MAAGMGDCCWHRSMQGGAGERVAPGPTTVAMVGPWRTPPWIHVDLQ